MFEEKGAWEERLCWRSRRFHALGRICFSSYIFNFLRAEVEGFLISHFSILLLVFFRNIYISSSSLFDIIRFFFFGFG